MNNPSDERKFEQTMSGYGASCSIKDDYYVRHIFIISRIFNSQLIYHFSWSYSPLTLLNVYMYNTVHIFTRYCPRHKRRKERMKEWSKFFFILAQYSPYVYLHREEGRGTEKERKRVLSYTYFNHILRSSLFVHTYTKLLCVLIIVDFYFSSISTQLPIGSIQLIVESNIIFNIKSVEWLACFFSTSLYL